MRKMFTLILTICISLFLISCDNIKLDGGSQEKEPSYVKGETVLVSHKEVITELDVWMQTHYVGDTLYYALSGNQETNESSSKRVYARSIDGEVILKLENENMMPWSFSVDKDHNLYFITWTKTDKGNEYHLIKQNASGEEEYKMALSEQAEVFVRSGIMDAAVSQHGYCILTIDGTCIMWNQQGEPVGKRKVLWIPAGMDYYEAGDYGLVNGKEHIYIYRGEGTRIILQKVDFEQGRLGNEEEVPKGNRIYSGDEQGLYVADEKNLYIFDEKSRGLSEVISWHDEGIHISQENIREITVDDQGVPTFYGYDEAKGQGILYNLEVRRKEDFNLRSIELGYIYDHHAENLSAYVEDFNSAQGEITVVLRKYKDLTTLHLDLIQGKGPDLLHLYEVDIDEYVEKGILENLDPYFENSNFFKKEDLLPSLCEAMSRKGSMYYLFPLFSIDAIVLKDGYAESGAISTQEFLSLASEEGYLCNKDVYILADMLAAENMNQYIDWENRKCSFDDGRFAEFLEWMKNADLAEVGSDAYENFSPADQLYQDKYMALFTNVNTIFRYREIQNTFAGFGELIGYPNQDGEEKYPIYTAGSVLGINAASENKAAAWAYLDYYIHEAAAEQLRTLKRSGRTSHFSVLEDAFNELIDSKPIPGVTYHMYNQYTKDTYLGTFEFTEDEKEALREIVDQAVWSDRYLTGMIGAIINEESAYYFSGQKTAKEVADIIQSRVSLYMEE